MQTRTRTARDARRTARHRRARAWLAAGALAGSVAVSAVPLSAGTSTTAGAVVAGSTAAVAPSTLQRALAIVRAFRDAGPLTVATATASPATAAPAGGARTTVDARDQLGEVVVEVTEPGPRLALVTAWAGGTTSDRWSFDPSSPASPVSGPLALATSVTQVAIGAGGTQPTSAATTSGPAGAVTPSDTVVAVCLVAAVTPALQGSPYGPLITFSGAVGFCTASPVTIVDTLILWQYKGGGYSAVGSSQAGGTNVDTDGSVVPCYSPWNAYYPFHTQMIVTLSYAGAVGYGYANSADASINCDH